MGTREYSKFKEDYDKGARRPIGKATKTSKQESSDNIGPSASPEELQQMQQEYDQSMKLPPTTQTSSLNNRTPAQASALDQYAEPTSAPSALDQYAESYDPNAEIEPTPLSPIQHAAQISGEWAPTIGGIAGGMAGMGMGPAGAIGGAALGGAAGQAYREFIETQVLKWLPSEEPMTNIAKSALTEGAGQAIGMGVGKVLGKVVSKAAPFVEGPINYMKNVIQAEKDSITAPILKIMAEKATTLSTEESGDMVKELLRKDILNKYGPFVQAYADLDTVSKATPIKDEARRGFTQKLREWGAEELAGDNYKILKKFVNDLDAADTGKKFNDVIKQIGDLRQKTLQAGAHNQSAFLKELRDRSDNFLESETTKLAARIQAGKASPQEMKFLNVIMESRGIQEPDPTKYAKSLAKDYLKAQDKIKKDYAGFRQFLEDVGEQTKSKTTKRGPIQFLGNIDEIPSEQLVDKMFDKRNAAALRNMQRETPQVFDQVSKAKISSLINKASPNGKLNLELFRNEVNSIPISTRNILFGSDAVHTINSVLDNPDLARLQKLNSRGENFMVRWAEDIMQASKSLSNQAGPNTKAVTRQVIGKPIAAPLVDAFIRKNPPEE